jgi:hypothetical protein
MRLSWKRLAVLLTAIVITLPVLAQLIPGGFGGPPNLATLISNSGVVEELKLTEEQQSAFKKITDAVADKFKDDFEKAKADKDFKAIGEIFRKRNEASSEAITKELDKILKPDQLKRLKQIELQALGLAAFTKESVVKDLKLTDGQTAKIKGLSEDLDKDIREMFKEATKDKFIETFKKAAEMRTAILDKVTGVLTDDQKKKWKEMTGDKYELKFGKFGK